MSESVDVVVHCRRSPDGPRVQEVVAVEDLAAGPEAANLTVTDVFRRSGPTGALAWTGSVPLRAARAFEDAGVDLRSLLGADPLGAGR